MATSFDALGLAGRVPLKLGHEDGKHRDSDGDLLDTADQFALGWVTRVYRAGKKLLSDWEVPESVYNAID